MPFTATYVDDILDGVGAAFPTSGNWRLYSSDPQLADAPSDVELTSDGGYAAVAFAPSDWDASTGGSMSTASAVSFGTSTDAYSDVATYWGITGADADDLVYSDFLDDPIEVDESGTAVSFTPSISITDGQ